MKSIESVLACLKQGHVDVGISPLFISGGFAVLFKQINLIRHQRCFVQDWYGGYISFFKIPVVSLSNPQIGIKCSVGCEVFLCTVKLLINLVFSSTHSTVTEMNPVNCVLLTVFYQSHQTECSFYRPTETFGFILFKNSWIN